MRPARDETERDREGRDESGSQSGAAAFRGSGANRAEDGDGVSDILLVRTAGIVGIPVGLHCAYRGGRSVSVWLFVEHSAFAAADARCDGQSSTDEKSG